MPTEAERAEGREIAERFATASMRGKCAGAVTVALMEARMAEAERIAVMAETMQNGFARGHAIAAAIRKGE